MECKPDEQGQNREASLFKKGQSGNPKGRPKKHVALSEAYRGVLSKEAPEDVVKKIRASFPYLPKKVSNLVALIHVSILEGLAGNSRALTEIFNRSFGLSIPTDPTEGKRNEESVDDYKGITDLLALTHGPDKRAESVGESNVIS